MPIVIGASLSEPHSDTSVTSLCMLACNCLDLAITVNFKSANFACTCTIIFKFNELLLRTSSMQGIVNRLATCSTDDVLI